MKHTRSLIFAAATAALALVAPMAGATPVDLRYQDSGNVFGVAGNRNASTTVQTNNTSGSFGAGAFAMEQVPGGDNTSLLPSKFLAYCLDLFNTITSPVKYEITSTPFVGATLGSDQKFTIARLFDVFVDTAKMLTNTALSTPNSQAMQLALWEVVYETGASYNVNSGDFIITGATNDIRTEANDLLAEATDATSTVARLWNPVFLQSPFDGDGDQISQNLVTVAPVPLPAGILMLLGAVGGLVAVRRRRSMAA
jgi:hypothetical protein